MPLRRSAAALALAAACCCAAAPRRSAATTLLFFNDHALARRDNVLRRVGQPGAPLSRYRDPANLTLNWAFPTVLPCQLSAARGGGRGYCMLYQGFAGATQGWRGAPTAKYGLVAESVDALSWAARDTREELPRLPGRRFVNQVKPWDEHDYGGAFAESECTFADPLAAGTPEHYKMLLSKTKYSAAGPNVTEYFTSPDAIHWTAQTWPFLWRGQQVFGGFFNPLIQRSTIISRPDGSDRRIVSHDVLWPSQGRSKTRPEWTLDTDALDTPLSEVYGMPVVPTRGYFVGLPWILHPSRIPDEAHPDEPVVSGVTGKVDAQLAWSMDGHHWERGIRTPLFPNGPPGSDTAGLVYPNSALLPRDDDPAATVAGGSSAIASDRDDILLFASASSVEHGKMMLNQSTASGSILTYRLRRDGWVSLYSGGGVGLISTRALEWGGGNLSLNVNAAGGEARAQISGAGSSEAPLPGLTFADCEVFTGDSTRWVPRWQNSSIGVLPIGMHIKLEIQLLGAELFAVSGNFILSRRYANSGAGLDPGYWQFHNGSHNSWPPPPPLRVHRGPLLATDLPDGTHYAIAYSYRHYTNKTLGGLACQSECDQARNCTSWTYVTGDEGGSSGKERCCMHGRLGCPVLRPGMMSGSKVNEAVCTRFPNTRLV